MSPAKSLGAYINDSGTFSRELGERTKQMKSAYNRLHGFWYTEDTPLRWRRALFLGTVVNSALSAIEAFLPTPAQYSKLYMAVAAILGARQCLTTHCGMDLHTARR